jgi:hypothetical protein
MFYNKGRLASLAGYMTTTSSTGGRTKENDYSF